MIKLAVGAFLIAVVGAKASECVGTDVESKYLDPNISNYVDSRQFPGDLDLAIRIGGFSCNRIYQPEKNIVPTGRELCPAEKGLPDKIRISAGRGPVSEYLKQNNFDCAVKNGYVHCLRAFRFTETPRNPVTGERVNPDIQDTYFVEVCVESNKNRIVSVKMNRFEVQVR